MINNRLNTIPLLLNNNKAKVGVELGVFCGDFSKVLLEKWNGTLYMIDPWRPIGNTYIDTCDIAQQRDLYTATTQNIKGYESRGFMLRGLGEELIDLFEDESLDFVYIDANHSYDYIKADMEMWYPKLKKGGIFSGHDYLSIDWYKENPTNPICKNGKDREIYSYNSEGKYLAGVFGVNPAVDEFCKKYKKDFNVTDEFWGTWYFTK